MFDNATGVGRRVCGIVRTIETFEAFSAHYGFDYSFCNPRPGHEKGNVERKVEFVRRNLFAPLDHVHSHARYNERLLERCEGLAKGRYLKDVHETELFVEDRLAMQGLPNRYDRCRSSQRYPRRWRYGNCRG